MPSPYELGARIGSNISGGFREAREQGVLDKILEEAANSKEANATNNAIAGILRNISPEKQSAAIGLLKQMESQVIQKKVQRENERFADQLELDNPGNRIYQTIANVYRSDIPTEEKHKIAKALTGGSSLTAEQRESKHKERQVGLYDKLIREIDRDLAGTLPQKEEDALIKRKNDLKRARDSLIEINGLLDTEEKSATEGKRANFSKEKPVFDEHNKAHMKRVEELEKEFGNDAEKIEAALQEEFRE